MGCAAVAVALDHRAAIRDLDIGLKRVLVRWKSYSDLAEALMVSDSSENSAKSPIWDVSAA